MAQGKLVIGSWNICGMNDAKKRALLLQMVIPMRLDVLCIQETHIPWGKRDLLKLPGYELVAYSKQTSMIRGAAILLKRGSGACIRSSGDKAGRWAIAELVIGNSPLTICSVYGSNLDDPELFKGLNVDLAAWSRPLLLCGDMNINLSNKFNVAGGQKYVGRKPRVFGALRTLVQEHDLTDVWHHHNSLDEGFTYYSAHTILWFNWITF